MNFNNKDSRANVSQEGVFDVHQATGVEILQCITGLRDGAPLIILENGALMEHPPRPIHTWNLK